MKRTIKIICSILVLTFLVQPVTGQVHEGYTLELPNTELSIKLVAIPEGRFSMGSPASEAGRNEDEGPERIIDVEGFWMSSHEITWELYNLFLNRSIAGTALTKRGDEVDIQVDAVAGATIPYVDMSLGMGTGPGLPVVNVTQLAASKFCEWLSAITGNFYRLPTEAEWEYAASAGKESPYFFGNDPAKLDAYAWYENNSESTYHEIGQKAPNPWGLYDIYGNVAEWTLDQYYPDAYAKEMIYQPTQSEYPVVVRGGSFMDASENLRSAHREASDPIWKQRDPQFPRSKWWHTDAGFVGFRIVRPIKTPTKEEFYTYWGVID